MPSTFQMESKRFMEMPVVSSRHDGFRWSVSHQRWMIQGCPRSHRLTGAATTGASHGGRRMPGLRRSSISLRTNWSSPRSHRRTLGRNHMCVPLADAGCLGGRVTVGMPTLTGCTLVAQLSSEWFLQARSAVSAEDRSPAQIPVAMQLVLARRPTLWGCQTFTP